MEAEPKAGQSRGVQVEALQEKLGHVFQDPGLLRRALTHPSAIPSQRSIGKDNQRLEFLGDAVLQLALTEFLYQQFPKRHEGDLTQLRARLVNRQSLCFLARQMDLGRHLILGRGEAKNDGRDKPSNLADAFEALLGAVYLDADWPQARAVALRFFAPLLEEEQNTNANFNPKGQLQEWLQGKGMATPEYEVVAEEGPDHEKSYAVIVKVSGVEIAKGHGPSKKTAEQDAAAKALQGIALKDWSTLPIDE